MRAYENSGQDEIALRELRTIPNVGPAMAADLLRLGVRRPADLMGRDPDDLYEQLAWLDGRYHDPCVRDVFAAAVAYVETREALPWWSFTEARHVRDAEKRVS